MTFEEYKERYKKHLELSGVGFLVSERELQKMFLSHIVMSEYNRELATQKRILAP